MPVKIIADMTLAELGDELNNELTNARNVRERIKADGRQEESATPAEQDEMIGYSNRVSEIVNARTAKQKFIASMDNLTSAEALLDSKGNRLSPAQIESRGAVGAGHVEWNPSRKKSAALNRRYDFTQRIGSKSYADGFSRYIKGQDPLIAFNAASPGMSVSDDERGGYFTCSEAFSTEILKNVDDTVYVQSLSKVLMMPPGAQNYGIRVRMQKASSFVWGDENTDMTNFYDTSLKYGKRVMTPNWLLGSCVMSKELIRNFPGAEGMVIGELGINMSETLEKAYLYGTGNQQPLGLMIPSANGIPTSQDYTSQRNAAFTFDDFLNMKYSLKPKYRGNAHFMFHRFILRDVCLLKDGEGQYLWQPGRTEGEPDRILGQSFTESEWMPSTYTPGAYFCILCDFQYYYVIWDMMMQMQRLVEMRARTNEYEYLFRCKVDAQPVLAEAFIRGAFGSIDA